MQLLGDDCALDRASRAVHGVADRLDGHLLEDDADHVLGAEHVAGPGIGGHDHRPRTVPAREPGALCDRHRAVAVVEHVLAEVPDRSVVSLGVAVERNLVEASVEVGGVLGEHDLDLLAAPGHSLGAGQKRGLRSERLAVHLPEQHDRVELAESGRVGWLSGSGSRTTVSRDPPADSWARSRCRCTCRTLSASVRLGSRRLPAWCLRSGWPLRLRSLEAPRPGRRSLPSRGRSRSRRYMPRQRTPSPVPAQAS